MKFAAVRKFALALPEVTEQPHHDMASFRVRGKIFVTVPPGREHIHVFLSEEQREQALVLYPESCAKLLWGGKVAGIMVTLAVAKPTAVKDMIRQAWAHKAPRSRR